MMLKKALLSLIGVLILSTLIAAILSRDRNSSLSSPLPPPDINKSNELSWEVRLAEMNSEVNAMIGTVVVSQTQMLHDFDSDSIWNVTRWDQNQDGFFEKILFDVDDNSEKDFMQLDFDHNLQLTTREIYMRVDDSWVRMLIASEVKLLDKLNSQAQRRRGYITKIGDEARYDFDGDNEPDVVERDRDQDSRPDTREYDLDGDGVLDYSWVDLNLDGNFEWNELYDTAGGRVSYSEILSDDFAEEDLLFILETLEGWFDTLQDLPVNNAEEGTGSIQDKYTTMLKYDIDTDGNFDTATLDLSGDGVADTVLFDLSRDGRAEYAWTDTNEDDSIDRAEVFRYESAKGCSEDPSLCWVPLFSEVLPGPMPFPSLYLP
jgi:hypothetical protein